MDKINALELKTRIITAAEKAKMDIVINFENLRETTPAALSALFDHGIKDSLHPFKIKCIHLSASFSNLLEQLNPNNLMFVEITPEEAY